MSANRFTAKVTTGDRKDAGTTSTVYMQLVDAAGKYSEKTCLDKIFNCEHKRGETQTYTISHRGLEKPEQIDFIVVWREKMMILDNHWFLEKIVLEDTKDKKNYIYPVQRWIEVGKHYNLRQFDAVLPQEDKQAQERKLELARKRLLYNYKEPIRGGPKLVKDLPEDENYSFYYIADLIALKLKLTVSKFFVKFTTGRWESFEDMKKIYKDEDDMKFTLPKCVEYWKQDRWFGMQRLQGTCPGLIRLCKELPSNLAVTAADLEPFMEGLSLEDAIAMKKLFVTDLAMLDGIPCEKRLSKMVSPIALFYLNKNKDLMPIAIQLYQKPGAGNPVYYPSDHSHTWLLAKMFYNMGEVQYHQSVTHIAYTHFIAEVFWMAANRNLSQSHPIFRLLAPHFLFLLATNDRGLTKLLYNGGWAQTVMVAGTDGVEELIGKGFRKWTHDCEGNVEKQLEERGVLDPNVLPYYPYRDDALPVYKSIRKYVTGVVKHFYDSDEKVVKDYEMQDWVHELSTPQAKGGSGVKGVPEKLEKVEQLVDIVTAIISTCSLVHAAVNFPQYEAYAFSPNYAASMTKDPPKEKKEMTEKELLEYLPDKNMTLDTMLTTRILSTKSTLSLGDFEVQYLYNPEVVKIADEFRAEMKQISKENKERNQKREFKYDYLDPEFIPNSISI